MTETMMEKLEQRIWNLEYIYDVIGDIPAIFRILSSEFELDYDEIRAILWSKKRSRVLKGRITKKLKELERNKRWIRSYEK